MELLHYNDWNCLFKKRWSVSNYKYIPKINIAISLNSAIVGEVQHTERLQDATKPIKENAPFFTLPGVMFDMKVTKKL